MTYAELIDMLQSLDAEKLKQTVMLQDMSTEKYHHVECVADDDTDSFDDNDIRIILLFKS